MFRRIGSFSTILAGVFFGAANAQTASVPQGCEALATFHKSQCHATTVFQCANGKQALTYFDGDLIVRHIYANDWSLNEFQFAEMNGASMALVPGSGTTAPADQLLATGSVEENGDFLLNTGVIKNRKYTLAGRSELSQDTVEISGVSFRTGRIYRTFELKLGAGGLEFEVDLYVSENPDLFVEASWQRSIFGNNLETFEQEPQSISLPGEAGFMAIRPVHGCE